MLVQWGLSGLATKLQV